MHTVRCVLCEVCVVRWVLFAAGCWLWRVRCVLCGLLCRVLRAARWLSIAGRCVLCVARRTLRVVRCALCGVWFVLCDVCGVPLVVRRNICDACHVLCGVRRVLCVVYCVVRCV